MTADGTQMHREAAQEARGGPEAPGSASQDAQGGSGRRTGQIRRGPHVAGQPAADRLMQALDYRLHPHARSLTPAQVAVVLHALADHTALEAARTYRQPDDGYCPTSTAFGRWLHDTADQLTEETNRG